MTKIVFAGAARDCGQFLPAVFANFERLSALSDETGFVLIENDSTDDTRQQIEAWGRGRRNFIFHELKGLGRLPVRTLRLEFIRNLCLELARGDSRFADYDVLCITDMDDVSTRPLDPAALRAALEFLRRAPDCAAIFGNNLGMYYDVWAFRHPELCPSDAWFEVVKASLVEGLPDQEAFDSTFGKRIRTFAPTLDHFEVHSAFGGFGLYRLDYVRRAPNPYVGSRVYALRDSGNQTHIVRMQQCEHVHFNEGLRTLGGKLYLLPWLITSDTSNVTIPCHAFRSLIF